MVIGERFSLKTIVVIIYWKYLIDGYHMRRRVSSMNLTVYTGPDPEANLTEMLRRTPLATGSVCAVVPDR